MGNTREEALKLVAEMISPQVAAMMADPASAPPFGKDLATLALDNVFGDIWARPGLSRRDRSLVTLGILIALRAEGELRFHVPAALKNGLTMDELAEVIYQASGYAGFPAASLALKVAREALP